MFNKTRASVLVTTTINKNTDFYTLEQFFDYTGQVVFLLKDSGDLSFEEQRLLLDTWLRNQYKYHNLYQIVEGYNILKTFEE